MTRIMETRGIYSSLYFIALVVMGAFFVINLVVAVIYSSYSRAQNDMETKDHISLLMLTLGDSPDDQSTASTVVDANDYVANCHVQAAIDVLEKDEDDDDDEDDSDEGAPAGEMVSGRLDVNDVVDEEDEDTFVEDDETIVEVGEDGHHIQSLVHRLSARFPGKVVNTVSGFVHKSKYRRLKKRCDNFVSSEVFEVGIMLLVVFNVAVLILLANGATGNVAQFARISNFVCTILFTVELLLQIFSSSIPAFFSQGFNILDTLIVLVSLLELAFSSDSGVSAFRSLRAFRTLKLFKRSESLQQLLFTIFNSASGLGYFCLVLSLYLFMGALSGMALFAGELDRDARSSDYISISESVTDRRANYDTLWFAFLTTFQIATGEGWTQILYRMMDFRPVVGSLYCIIIGYIIGYLCVMKLFLVIVLDTCSQKSMDGAGLSYLDTLEKNMDAEKFGIAGNKIWQVINKYLKTLTADVASASELGSIQFINMVTKKELEKASLFKHKSIWQGQCIYYFVLMRFYINTYYYVRVEHNFVLE
jgi:hypothetical protein